MPVEWLNTEGAPADAGALSDCGARGLPLVRLRITPSRSMSRKGFAWLLLITWGLLLVPLIPLLGTLALWVMLPFLLGALLLLWFFVERNFRDGELSEDVTLWTDLIQVRRNNPRGPGQTWEANPYWTKLALRPEGGPVENYLTLKGNGREIELGAFLSPEERVTLHGELERAMSKARRTGPETGA